MKGEEKACQTLIRVSTEDNVASALQHFDKGDVAAFGSVQLPVLDEIPVGHKVALVSIASGEEIIKYGWPIGAATCNIAAGSHVHVHNIKTQLGTDQPRRAFSSPTSSAAEPIKRTFRGYVRKNGKVGTRNEIWVLCTVGCVSAIARNIAKTASQIVPAGIDGVYAFPHPFGCSQLGDDLNHTRKLLASLACNPNAAGVLIIGLGCENNQLSALMSEIPRDEQNHIRTLIAQTATNEVEEGVAAVLELAAAAATNVRSEVGLDKLVLGLKCGGSDGFSGLTANPIVGDVATMIDLAGGTTILTEIPEIFGAEHVLLGRAKNSGVCEEAASLIEGFKQYFLRHGEPVHENPSPGNKAGGISTLEEKSLGAIQKAGSARLAEIVRYGERVCEPGLAIVEAPGNDAISATALAAAGANLILFTTGRGTPMGFPVPTLKIASNTDLSTRKPHWIDFDAGSLLFGASRNDIAQSLLDKVIAYASGERVKAEINGEREIAIWKSGVTL